MNHSVFSEWVESIRGLNADQLLEQARITFGSSETAALPDHLRVAEVVACLSLSGKDFVDLYSLGTMKSASTSFLLDLRESIHRDARNSGHIIMPFDGSEFDARRAWNSLVSGEDFHYNLRSCLAELALSTCSIDALMGSDSDLVDVQIERRFLDKVADAFIRQFGPMRGLEFHPRLPQPALIK